MTAAASLARYRWHTGAPMRRVDDDEALPPLVRDVGPVALAQFLRGGLKRLAGPQTPLLYLRTTAWIEPYVDHAGTGRLLFLDPHGLDVWFSGIEGVYVAAADQQPRDPASLGYLPAGVDVPTGLRTAHDLRDVVVNDRERAAHDLAALDVLNAACETVEAISRPLRWLRQCGTEVQRGNLRELMAAVDVDEADLCGAFHHLAISRRETLLARLLELRGRFDALGLA
ncbi:MAG: hypothetical protein Q8O67_29870 [Deltaproteobacteria bacterium]|nr:hypothetical protein [Deltaproteobacteria bacterium]